MLRCKDTKLNLQLERFSSYFQALGLSGGRAWLTFVTTPDKYDQFPKQQVKKTNEWTKDTKGNDVKTKAPLRANIRQRVLKLRLLDAGCWRGSGVPIRF